MSIDADKVLERCSADALRHALDFVYRRLLSNILLNPNDVKYHRVRKGNTHISSATRDLPSDIVELLFSAMGFQQASDPNSEPTYVFNGDVQKLCDADHFFSLLESKIREQKMSSEKIKFPGLESRGENKGSMQLKQLTEDVRRVEDIPLKDVNEYKKNETVGVLNSEDFSSVEHLKEVARLTLLKSGRVRNTLFEGRHFTLRRMLTGRVYACKEGCAADCLEAHWHLYTGKNLLYSYVAHLTPDASSKIHLGVEHGYQYNSLPGTVNFRRTIHFTAKRVSEENGKIVYLEHPNRPCDECIYCGVRFSELFL